MRRLLFFALAILSTGMTFPAIGVRSAPPVEAKAIGLSEVSPLFERHCVSCHNAEDRLGGLDLEAGHAYRELVGRTATTASGMQLVVPEKPGQSYLYAKLTGRYKDIGGFGGIMPLGQPSLSAEEIGLIERWIAQGARP